MPEGTIYVGRGTKWGNPHTVSECGSRKEAVARYLQDIANDPLRLVWAGTAALELRGHDLACWCPIGTPCHADVLIDIANMHSA